MGGGGGRGRGGGVIGLQIVMKKTSSVSFRQFAVQSRLKMALTVLINVLQVRKTERLCLV